MLDDINSGNRPSGAARTAPSDPGGTGCGRLDAIGVGIPACDEEARIAACLTSVLAAASRIELPVVVVVTADRCTDGTVRHARAAIERFPKRGRVAGVVLSGAYGSAGGARAAALDGALTLSPAPPERCWLATTDADTTVSMDWLEAQLRWAQRGADGVAGLVEVDWEEGPASLPGRFAAAIAADGTAFGHRHVHGANLGLRGHRWVEVGGCGAAAVGEDHELWRRLRAVGAHLHGVDDVRVRTSGRLVARAPLGFSRYLTELCDTEVRRRSVLGLDPAQSS
ncbi:glycosyltransferase [soil metagenome]